MYTSNLIHWIKEEISNTPQGTKQILIWFLRWKGVKEFWLTHKTALSFWWGLYQKKSRTHKKQAPFSVWETVNNKLSNSLTWFKRKKPNKYWLYFCNFSHMSSQSWRKNTLGKTKNNACQGLDFENMLQRSDEFCPMAFALHIVAKRGCRRRVQSKHAVRPSLSRSPHICSILAFGWSLGFGTRKANKAWITYHGLLIYKKHTERKQSFEYD